MSLRCAYGWTGDDTDACGDPADAECVNCETPLCLDHASRGPAGHHECPNCRRDREAREARARRGPA